MKKNNDIELVDAYSVSGATGVLTVEQTKDLANKVQQQVNAGKTVAISMKNISSLSLDASTTLYSELKRNNLTKNVLVVGSTPYVRQIIARGTRNTKKKK